MCDRSENKKGITNKLASTKKRVEAKSRCVCCYVYNGPFACSWGGFVFAGDSSVGPTVEVAEATASVFSTVDDSATTAPSGGLTSSVGEGFKTAGATVGLFPADCFALDVSRFFFLAR